MNLLLLALGFVLLTFGAEALVRGASGIAARLGIPPLVIGLTVVAFGTSAPEFAVSLGAAWTGQADIAMGNVVGSNIFNILFVLGLSALVAPLVIHIQLIRVDVPLMIGASVLILVFGLDGHISRLEGAALFTGLILYIAFQVRQGRRERANALAADELPAGTGRWWLDPLLTICGLGILVLGSRFLVDAAVAIAQTFGVSELVIGLTIVAIGTSLPEVATSVVASLRGQRDIAVGNAVGSSVFNLLGVLGLTSLVSPAGVAVADQALQFDLPVMVAVALACLPVFVTGLEIARWEGAMFLAYYIAYTLYLVLTAMHDTSLAAYSAAMLWFVLPLTTVTLILLFTRDRLRAGNGES
jgi:cation:H+ antiporter